jgi:3-oxoacyl-[acyl-carrier protein] reductase
MRPSLATGATIMGRLDGKVAVITGAASGIGEASARRFAEEGAQLVLADIDGDGLERVAQSIRRESSADCLATPTDVSQGEQVAAMVASAVDRFGRLDVIYNNAGIGAREGRITECSEETFDAIVAVNLKGVWHGIKHAAPVLEAAGGGSIICTASVAGLTGLSGQAAYNASKAGVISFVKTAAGELAASGIRVNCVCPGAIVTGLTTHGPDDVRGARERLKRFHPLGRAGDPTDIADAVVWLASDESSFVTGQSIVVDGGWTAVEDRWQRTVFERQEARRREREQSAAAE